MKPSIGDAFKCNLSLSDDEVVEGAQFVGDANPIHSSPNHDNKRVSGIIASGSHVSAMFSGMIPTHLSQFGAILGLEMSFRFKSPVFPNLKYIMEWRVSHKEWSVRLAGHLITLDGDITGPSSSDGLYPVIPRPPRPPVPRSAQKSTPRCSFPTHTAEYPFAAATASASANVYPRARYTSHAGVLSPPLPRTEARMSSTIAWSPLFISPPPAAFASRQHRMSQ